MGKTILFAAALLLLGAIAGNGIARYSAAQHRHTRAVMTLAQFHFDRLSAAAKAGQCSVFVEERERLFRVYGELILAFPKPTRRTPNFTSAPRHCGMQCIPIWQRPASAAPPPRTSRK